MGALEAFFLKSFPNWMVEGGEGCVKKMDTFLLAEDLEESDEDNEDDCIPTSTYKGRNIVIP